MSEFSLVKQKMYWQCLKSLVVALAAPHAAIAGAGATGPAPLHRQRLRLPFASGAGRVGHHGLHPPRRRRAAATGGARRTHTHTHGKSHDMFVP